MSEAVGIALIVLAFVGFAGFLVWRHHRIRTENDDLLTHGALAVATVERIAPVLGEHDLFLVRLSLDGHALEVRWFLPSHVLPSVQPGRSVAVRVDTERRRAAFDARAMGFG
ncbi:MAG: hypothetical protein MUE69_19870 [Myxococcota bacterium]|jgi:hypothetical protein|nr:hypothetical protein [Myxococcota bacterium]